jgi:CHAT domain-containing protein
MKYQDKGLMNKAEVKYLAALSISRKCLAPACQELSLRAIAALYEDQSRSEEAVAAVIEASKIRSITLDPHSEEINIAAHHLGKSQFNDEQTRKAQAYLGKEIELRRSLFGHHHHSVGTSLINLVFLHSTNAEYKKAELLCREALEIRRIALGSKHELTCNCLYILGMILCRQGDSLQAIPFLHEALDGYQDAAVIDSSTAFDLVLPLIHLYIQDCRRETAESLYKQHSAALHKALESNQEYLIVTLGEFFLWHLEGARYQDAEFYALETLKLCQANDGIDTVNAAMENEKLATLYSLQKKWVQAIQFGEEALAIRKKILDPSDPLLVDTIARLAGLYSEQKTYDRAEALYGEALQACEGNLSLVQDTAINCMECLAGLAAIKGDYQKVELYGEKLINAKRQQLGEQHREYILFIVKMAGFYFAVGCFRGARELYQEAAEKLDTSTLECEQVIGEILIGLFNVHCLSGDVSQADMLEQRVMDIYEDVLARWSFSAQLPVVPLVHLVKSREYQKVVKLCEQTLQSLVAGSKSIPLNKTAAYAILSYTYHTQKNLELARDCCVQAINSYRESRGILDDCSKGNGEICQVTLVMAIVCFEQKYYQQAEFFAQETLCFLREHAPNNWATAKPLDLLAQIYLERGEYKKAELCGRKALSVCEDSDAPKSPLTTSVMLTLAKVYLAIEDHVSALRVLRKIRIGMAIRSKELIFLPVVRRESVMRDLLLFRSLACTLAWADWSSLELVISARINYFGFLQLIERRHQEMSRLSGVARNELDQLADLITALASASVSTQERSTLQSRRDVLERQIFSQLPNLVVEPCCIADVAAALPERGVLVEFEHVQAIDRYLAFAIWPQGNYGLIDLGSALELESLIEQALIASTDGLADAPRLWLGVSQKLISPLNSQIGNVQHWFLTLDGALHRIPFAALPWPDAAGKWLTDAIDLTLVTTGRDLLDLNRPSTCAGPPLILANPRFDQRNAPTKDSESGFAMRSRDMNSLGGWKPLPGTAEEGRQVAELLGAALLVEADATTINLQRAFRPKVLHTATHGYFLPNQPDSDADSIVLHLDSFGPLGNFRGEDPMLRSGLVLAGADHPDSNPNDDGYLTALEATHLDLQGTELVTLSACDTGRGDIRTGEGVYGLQRALIVAGARSMLLSLWKVPDDATCDFMVRFYTLLKQGAGRYEALVAVQREFRNHRNPIWRDLSYWGAWQLIGDWRPIEGL